jgi:hypothetical protein
VLPAWNAPALRNRHGKRQGRFSGLHGADRCHPSAEENFKV